MRNLPFSHTAPVYRLLQTQVLVLLQVPLPEATQIEHGTDRWNDHPKEGEVVISFGANQGCCFFAFC